MVCVAVIDTTFARVDMAKVVIETIIRLVPSVKIKRYTVPGIKDIPVAAKKLLDEGCDAAIALGWVGATQNDKFSYLAYSIGLQMVQILTSKHVIDVTVHEDEEGDLKKIALDRARKHAENLVALLRGPTELTPYAGKGKRQGREDVGPL